MLQRELLVTVGQRRNEVVLSHGTKIPKAHGAHHAPKVINVPGKEATLKGIQTVVDVRIDALQNPVARLMILKEVLATIKVVSATATNEKVPRLPAVAKAKRAKEPKETTPVVMQTPPRRERSKSSSHSPGGTHKSVIPTDRGWMSRGNSVNSVNSTTGRPNICFHFRDSGKCKDGDECPYQHGSKDSRDLTVLRRSKKPPQFNRSTSKHAGKRGERPRPGAHNRGGSRGRY